MAVFNQQVRDICETYRAAPQRLEKEGIHTVCVDENTGIQATERIAPTRPMIPGHPEQNEFEYKRHGTQTLIGHFEIATGKVIAPTIQQTRNEAICVPPLIYWSVPSKISKTYFTKNK